MPWRLVACTGCVSGSVIDGAKRKERAGKEGLWGGDGWHNHTGKEGSRGGRSAYCVIDDAARDRMYGQTNEPK